MTRLAIVYSIVLMIQITVRQELISQTKTVLNNPTSNLDIAQLPSSHTRLTFIQTRIQKLNMNITILNNPTAIHTLCSHFSIDHNIDNTKSLNTCFTFIHTLNRMINITIFYQSILQDTCWCDDTIAMLLGPYGEKSLLGYAVDGGEDVLAGGLLGGWDVD